MILVDKNIRSRVEAGELIIEEYNESNVNCISYDLTIDKIIKPIENSERVEEVRKYILEPNEYIIIKTKEKLKIPNNVVGRIGEKNSLMRTGIVVAGPHYQPGHETYAYLRIINMSYSNFELKGNQKIAQIIFEELKEIPQTIYSSDERASFNNEMTYKGYGRYESLYKKSIKKIEKVNENIENKEGQIYANILTFMGIFVSIFGLITLNFDVLFKTQLSIQYLWIINLSLALVITILMGLILIFINKKDNKFLPWIFVLILIGLIVVNLYTIGTINNEEAIAKTKISDIMEEN